MSYNQFTSEGIVNINNNKYLRDDSPIDRNCECPACKNHTKGYIRHLLKAKEMLGMRLCVQHNIYFYNKLMEDIRLALDEDRFEAFRKEKLEVLSRRL